MRAVTLLINSFLPPELRDPNRVFDKKGLDDLLAKVALKHPDRYAEIVKKIADVGRKSAYLQGTTLKLSDMRPTFDKDALLDQMDREIAKASRGIKDPELARKTKLGIWSRYASDMEKMTIDSALASRNNLGNTVISGARGNPFQLKAMITTPGLYTDYKGKPIEFFVRNSFAEGLRPAAYLASSYGTRSAVLSTKNSTARGGDYGKQLAQATTGLTVTEDDCGAANGLDYTTDDPEVDGRFLARDAGPVAAGTPLDKHTVAALRKAGVKNIVTRSPLTCQSKRGICATCLGQLPDGKMAPLGYQAGITASNAISEPVVQGALNSKHTGGGFGGKKKEFSGFNVLNQLVQSPETFPDKATVAEIAGKVEKIEDAPQGGKFVTIGEHQHYVLPEFELNVKPGDQVEAGEPLSEGIVDVADILRLRGLGEARKYYVDRLRQAYTESGLGAPSKLNLETVARATLDHVRVEDPEGMGDVLPDDVASYSSLVPNYSPPASTRLMDLEQANGHYLQSPMLHYTIGTKLTPKMTAHLKSNGFKSAPVTAEEPKFFPQMVRLRAAVHDNPDWMVRLNSSYLGANLQDAASRALDTNVEKSQNPIPRLAIGKDFGKNVAATGFF